MKVLLFGASGMVGQGVLREALTAPDVMLVQTVGRSPHHSDVAKHRDIAHGNLFDLTSIEQDLEGFDLCFFSLGVSSAGMSEADYAHITYDLTLSIARTLLPLNPNMVFIYVSGAGTDTSEGSRSMWARVKGRTENALLQMPFRGVYLFRPGLIQPLDGIRSRTRSYRLLYTALAPALTLVRTIAPGSILTTAQLGRAALTVGREGAAKPILEARELRELGRSSGS